MSSSRPSQTTLLNRVEIRRLPGLLHGRDDIHGHVEGLLDPFALVLSLWICALAFDRSVGSQYLILSLAVVMLTFPGRSRLHVNVARLFVDAALYALTLMSLLIFFGWATKHLNVFATAAITNWLWFG